jgi:hypothetical protein
MRRGRTDEVGRASGARALRAVAAGTIDCGEVKHSEHPLSLGFAAIESAGDVCNSERSVRFVDKEFP